MSEEMNLTVEISPFEIKELIRDYLMKKGFDISKATLAFKVSNEYDMRVFEGCEVKNCKLKI